MKRIQCLWILSLVAVLVVLGCKGSDQTSPAGKQYPIKGKVVAVDTAKPSVKLDHEEIPELQMKAMEMEYPVENSKVLEGIKDWSQVQGHLKTEAGNYVVTHLERR